MKYAEVDFWLGAYQATVDTLQTMALSPTEGQGLTHDETVQVASCFAVWRDYCAHGGSAAVAFYRGGKFFYASDSVTLAQFKRLTKQENGDEPVTPVFIWGDGPAGFSRDFKPGEGLPDDWGAQLALACDWSIEQLEQAKQAPSVPTQGGERPVNVALPAAAVTTAIIIGGAAVGVIGTVAAWRFLDPDTRTRLAGISAAADAWMARINAFKETGTMPPPSEAEKGAREAVEEASDKSERDAWMKAGMFGGGIVVGSVAASWINHKIRGAA